MAIKKEATQKQRAIRDRDYRIRATYFSLPEGAWTIRQIAKLFEVSRMTAWYAIHGRGNNKRQA